MESSSFGRLIGVLTSPGATFRSIAEKPTVALALIIFILATMGSGLAMTSKTDTEELVRAQIEGGGQQLSEAEMEQAISFGEKFKYIGPAVGSLIFVPLVFLVGSGILLVVLKVMGSEIGFKQTLSTYVHGSLPAAVSALLAIPVALAKGEISVETLNTGSPLMSNLAFLASDDASAAETALLASIDVFGLWALVLTVIGVSIVGRVSKAKAAVPVVLVWLLGVALRVGFASMGG